MARHSSLREGKANPNAVPPELRDADYVHEVLNACDGTTEADMEQRLLAKAAALGIETSGQANAGPEQETHMGSSLDTPNLPRALAGSADSDGAADDGTEPQTSDHTTATHAAPAETSARRRSKSLSFSLYEQYISQVDPAIAQPKFLRPANDRSEWSAGVVVRSATRKGVRSFTKSIAAKLRRKRPTANLPMPCVCCQEDFLAGNSALHTLPCGHLYCRDCLAVMVDQSITDESRMPPRCCTQPIPSAIIKTVLPREKQHLFLKAVVQYSTPWEARIFCPNTSCGEFIPPADRVDPKRPFEALCKTCKTRACVMCKRNAHQLGQDCPEDFESNAVLKLGESSGWRRCYKCRALVELAHGCTHITCRCKAQFCYICGAVWDPDVGCPNFCNGEEELERRRVEEEARLAELEAEKLAAEKAALAEETARREAEKRTLESSEFRSLREQFEAEMARFSKYELKARDAMRSRQLARKRALVDRFADAIDRMRERHAKTEQHLEDRQVMAEIELAAGLAEKEKKVRIKLKYMEDYCSGKTSSGGGNSGGGDSSSDAMMMMMMPRRRVTDRDREQLRQQYCVRDGMERRHQSLIHGLREKQVKSMEELVGRHAREMEALVDRRAEEVEDLAVEFANEAEVLVQRFAERRAKLLRRWALAAEILKVELERREGKPFAAMELPPWPEPQSELEEVDGEAMKGIVATVQDAAVVVEIAS
ncbi:hypothetical protein N657DRAFT_569954 [Parathielavia appendiculata]|uniref:RBR-type E3 ubiquitin transferase n=1 Tax=Parathielavia appendiculata TaxID=2587402 RepID=A0AAN6Z425_9PEZI|nr:hypothetical protein N657DRAFT_569954 [Parathielavia appendiculata]